MKTKIKIGLSYLLVITLVGCSGCTMGRGAFVALNPFTWLKPSTYKEIHRQHEVLISRTNLTEMARERDGTNYIGVFMGMIAEYDSHGHGSVMMFSATSGQLLRWISYDEFNQVYVLKTKPEYPSATEETYRKYQQTNNIISK